MGKMFRATQSARQEMKGIQELLTERKEIERSWFGFTIPYSRSYTQVRFLVTNAIDDCEIHLFGRWRCWSSMSSNSIRVNYAMKIYFENELDAMWARMILDV